MLPYSWLPCYRCAVASHLLCRTPTSISPLSLVPSVPSDKLHYVRDRLRASAAVCPSPAAATSQRLLLSASLCPPHPRDPQEPCTSSAAIGCLAKHTARRGSVHRGPSVATGHARTGAEITGGDRGRPSGFADTPGSVARCLPPRRVALAWPPPCGVFLLEFAQIRLITVSNSSSPI